MNLRIDVAGRGDRPLIAATDGHHVRHGLAGFGIDPPAVDEALARHAALAAAGYRCLAARQRTTALGCADASAFRSRPACRYTVEDSV